MSSSTDYEFLLVLGLLDEGEDEATSTSEGEDGDDYHR